MKVEEKRALGEIPDVGIFMHRIGIYHEQQLASLVRTLRSFNLVYVYERGTAHQNINRVLDRSTARYLAICDDDVVFLDERWLDTLIDELRRVKDAGLITPMETKDSAVCKRYQVVSSSGPKVTYSTSWNAGYVMVLDRERVPNIRADEMIPGRWGMSDLDICLQVRKTHRVLLTNRTIIYHGKKPDNLVPSSDELIRLHEEQKEYMVKKWGSVFTDVLGDQTMEVKVV